MVAMPWARVPFLRAAVRAAYIVAADVGVESNSQNLFSNISFKQKFPKNYAGTLNLSVEAIALLAQCVGKF